MARNSKIKIPRFYTSDWQIPHRADTERGEREGGVGGCPRYIAKKTPSLPFAPASPTHRAASATVNPERKLYGGGRVRLPWGGRRGRGVFPFCSLAKAFFGGEGGLGQRGRRKRRSAQKFDEKVAEAQQENRRHNDSGK